MINGFIGLGVMVSKVFQRVRYRPHLKGEETDNLDTTDGRPRSFSGLSGVLETIRIIFPT